MTTGSITNTTTSQGSETEKESNNMLLSVGVKPHNTSMLLNLEDKMSMKAHALPTMDKGFYTDLVDQESKREPFIVQIPVELDDAYNFGDQYMQRLID